MGSGKTVVALSVALYAIGRGWEEARSKVDEWSARAVNNDPVKPFVPMKYVAPYANVRASRVAIIIVPHTLADQWQRAIRANLPEGHAFKVADSASVISVLQKLEGTDRPSIVLVVSRRSTHKKDNCVNHIGIMTHMALAALVVDEAPLVMSSVAGRNAKNLLWPPVFRTVLLTAQPVKLLQGRNLGRGSATALKALIHEDPSIGTTSGPHRMQHRLNAFIRFSLADPAAGVQRELSIAASARMQATMDMRNVWLPTTSMRALMPAYCAQYDSFNNAAYPFGNAARRTTVLVDEFIQVVEGAKAVQARAVASIRACNDSTRSLYDVMFDEMGALIERLRQPLLCAACAQPATRVSTCCLNLLCDEHTATVVTEAAAFMGCAACAPTLAAPHLDELSSVRNVNVHCALAHVLRCLVHDGHTRIVVLLSLDAKSTMGRMFNHDGHYWSFDVSTEAVKCAAPSATFVDGRLDDAQAKCSNAAGVAIIVLSDVYDFDSYETMTGVDLPQCDAVVALGRMNNEAQAFSRALRPSPNPRAVLPVVRIFWHGCKVTPKPYMLVPIPALPHESTPTFARDVLRATLRLDGELEDWGYDHRALRSVSFTFRGEGFERLVVGAPPVVALDGNSMGDSHHSLSFTFASCVDCECVPAKTRGIMLRHEGKGIQFSWISDADPPTRLWPVANCAALEVEVVTAAGDTFRASCSADEGGGSRAPKRNRVC